MTDFIEGQDYRVVLKTVPAEAVESVVAELVQLFPIDRAPAAQIAQAAPIILIDKLNPAQARNVESNLVCLRRLGAEVEINSETTTLKRLNWPVMPDIVRHAGNVIICPHCGERLAVHPVSSVQPVMAPAAKSAIAAAAAPAQPAPRPEAAAERPLPAPDSRPALKAEPPPDPAFDFASLEFDGEEPKPGAAEPALPAAEKPVAPPKPEAARPAAGRWSAAKDDDDDAPLELLVEEDVPKKEIKPKAPAPALGQRPAAAPKPAAPAPAAARPAAPAAAKPAPAAAKPAAPAAARPAIAKPPAASAAAARPASAASGVRVSFVAKLKSVQKKPVAELIAKHQGISIDEAMALTSKTVITVIRNATKEQVEKCRKDFQALGIDVQTHGR